MSNYEKIKSMSIEDLAIEICKSHERCDDCRYSNGCRYVGDGMRRWLESEASTEELSDEQIYELQSSERDYCMRYEPTYNSEDGSM